MSKQCLICNSFNITMIGIWQHPEELEARLKCMLGVKAQKDDCLCEVCYNEVLSEFHFKKIVHQSNPQKLKLITNDSTDFCVLNPVNQIETAISSSDSPTKIKSEIKDELYEDVKASTVDTEWNNLELINQVQKCENSEDNVKEENVEEATADESETSTPNLPEGCSNKLEVTIEIKKELEERSEGENVNFPRKNFKREKSIDIDDSNPAVKLPYRCGICNRIYRKISNFEKHKRKEHPVNDIFSNLKERQCEFCFQIFNSCKEFHHHVNTYHQGEEYPYRCNKSGCTSRFKYKRTLQYHINHHSEVKQYKCQYCDKIFVKKRYVRSHERLKHGNINPFTCSYCSKSFELFSLLNEHKKSEHERLFECRICSKKFKKSDQLEIHEHLHTNDRPYVCSECGLGFNQPQYLKQHEMIHTGERPYNCQYCSKTFRYRSSQVYHMRLHTNERPYTCFECGKSYVNLAKLNQHKKNHVDERPFKCSECGKSYVSSTKLNSHKKSHIDDRPHKCLLCSKAFKRNENLALHMEIHTGTNERKKLCCGECGKRFNNSYKLKIHEMVHKGEKPHKCSYCPKAFTIKYNCMIHLRSHTEEKPHSCSDCGKSFITMAKLKIHKEGHTRTRKKPENCPICCKAFKTYQGRGRHMQIHEKEKEKLA